MWKEIFLVLAFAFISINSASQNKTSAHDKILKLKVKAKVKVAQPISNASLTQLSNASLTQLNSATAGHDDCDPVHQFKVLPPQTRCERLWEDSPEDRVRCSSFATSIGQITVHDTCTPAPFGCIQLRGGPMRGVILFNACPQVKAWSPSQFSVDNGAVCDDICPSPNDDGLCMAGSLNHDESMRCDGTSMARACIVSAGSTGWQQGVDHCQTARDANGAVDYANDPTATAVNVGHAECEVLCKASPECTGFQYQAFADPTGKRDKTFCQFFSGVESAKAGYGGVIKHTAGNPDADTTCFHKCSTPDPEDVCIDGVNNGDQSMRCDGTSKARACIVSAGSTGWQQGVDHCQTARDANGKVDYANDPTATAVNVDPAECEVLCKASPECTGFQYQAFADPTGKRDKTFCQFFSGVESAKAGYGGVIKHTAGNSDADTTCYYQCNQQPSPGPSVSFQPPCSLFKDLTPTNDPTETRTEMARLGGWMSDTDMNIQKLVDDGSRILWLGYGWGTWPGAEYTFSDSRSVTIKVRNQYPQDPTGRVKVFWNDVEVATLEPTNQWDESKMYVADFNTVAGDKLSVKENKGIVDVQILSLSYC